METSNQNSPEPVIGYINEIVFKSLTVEGWLSDIQGVALFLLARYPTVPGEVVEIGSWKGRSAGFLAQGVKLFNNGDIHCIDTFKGSREHNVNGPVDTFPEFYENMDRLGLLRNIIVYQKTSEEANKEWNGKPIRLIFIDGSHEYEDVAKDLSIWMPYVPKGGFIVMDDTQGWIGPKRVFEEMIKDKPGFSSIQLGKMTIIQRT